MGGVANVSRFELCAHNYLQTSLVFSLNSVVLVRPLYSSYDLVTVRNVSFHNSLGEPHTSVLNDLRSVLACLEYGHLTENEACVAF